MTQRRSHIHPRKLYLRLRDCADARARAAAALDFALQATAASQGYLVLARAGELVVAASVPSRELPAGMMERAALLWATESEHGSEHDHTRTIDANQRAAALVESPGWNLADQCYEPRVLGIYRDARWVPVGITVLRSEAGSALLPIRRAHLDALCNAFIDAGDVASV